MQMKKKEVLIIAASGLSANPRVVKAIETLTQTKVKVQVLTFEVGGWVTENNTGIVAKYPGVKFHFISATDKTNFNLLFGHFVHKAALYLYPGFKRWLLISSFASNKRIVQLLMWLFWNKKHFKKTTHILAYNFGSYLGAYFFSNMLHARLVLDFEDFFPGEKIPAAHAAHEISRRKKLVQWMMGKKVSCMYAAPLIKEQFLKENRVKDPTDHLVINNVFASTEFQAPKAIQANPVQLVWFSQHISHGRGVEEILEALKDLNKYMLKAELTLIGNLNQDFFNEFISNASYVRVLPSLKQEELNKKLAEFDVGLALEMNSADLNRQLCLTNKIWAYLQAGLFIVATDTKAQVDFMKKFEEHGLISKQDTAGLKDKLEEVYLNKLTIRNNRLNRFEKAKQVSLEKESAKLVSLVFD